MKQILKYTFYILLLVIVGYLLWKFFYIIGWVLIAAVLSFIGHPLVRFFNRIHFKKIRIPHTVSALLSLLLIIIAFAGIIAIFLPLIINQAEVISKIDVNKLEQNLQGPLDWLNTKMHAFGAIPEEQTTQNFIVEKVKNIVNLGTVGSFFGNFITAAGNIFIGIFSVLFIAFFFLKDENMFQEGLLLFVPLKNHERTRKVIADSKTLLMRYFIGIFLELLGVMSLITIGLWILGVKNALLIGFFGGIMNIIPYLGPIIGSTIGIFLGISSTLALGSYNDLLPQTIKLISVFLVANFIDNNILVPLIYSKSVKSHPLEIFFVIIIGGGLAGLPGMLLAVPVYTLLRVIAKEFFNEFRVIKKLTETMD
ncbi:MAG TPA: AI-2E family transporter [Bacteroidales bacterium]|nr:AI-2E family transporter [Bacteroidales bacterium]